MKYRSVLLGTILLVATAVPFVLGGDRDVCLIPPVAEKIPEKLSEHGDTRIDDYYWMRERDSEPVLAYLNEENEYTRKYLSSVEPFKESLFEELKGRVAQVDDTVPYRKNGYYYYERYAEGKEYGIHCRKKGSLDAPEEVILDANTLAEGETFFNLPAFSVSPDGGKVAYAADLVGRRIYSLYVKDLVTGELIGEAVTEVTPAFAWANDSRTLFYAKQHPETLRWYQIFRHTIGSPRTDDILVYEEEDETFDVTVLKSRSDRYIFIYSGQTLSTEYRYLDADHPDEEPVLFQARERDHEYHLDHAGNTFYIRTNLDAHNFRVMTASAGNTARDRWRELVSHREDVLVEEVLAFREYLALTTRREGLPRIEILSLPGGEAHHLEFDEPAYLVWADDNYEVDTPVLRYYYSSMTTPETVFDYHMGNRERTLLKREEIPGGFEPEDYRVERVMVPARDGARIPMSLLYRKDLVKDGSNPALVYGYGSYGYTSDAEFSDHRFTLVDRGFIYAVAHVRGGQMLGRRWYEDGKLLRKKNSFNDFIDCAEYLLGEGYTSKELLFARGGSAGGLLIGAVINMRPDLFKGAVAEVPFVDVITTMLDDSVPLTTAEYDEWGNPHIKEYYDYMLSYSPYDNVEAKEYPALLITAGYHDSQVQYWEPAKWAAKIRDYKTDSNPLLLWTNMEAGHGGAYGRFERFREYALMYVFLLSLAGIEK